MPGPPSSSAEAASTSASSAAGSGARRLAGRRTTPRRAGRPKGPRLAGKGPARPEPLRCALLPVGDSAELRENFARTSQAPRLPAEPLPALTRAHFEAAAAEARRRLSGLAPQFMDRLGLILQLRQQAQQRIGAAALPALARSRTLSSLHQLGAPAAVRPTNPLAAELAALAPSAFWTRIEYDPIGPSTALSQGAAHPRRSAPP